MPREDQDIDIRVELAVMRKDIDAIREKVTDAHKDLEQIRGYFIKAFLGIGVLIGTYIVRWILTGGLESVL